MTVRLPRLALSVRQPWAWAIVTGHKPVENRSWRAPNPALNYRGPVSIHASRGMTQDEYEGAADFMRALGVNCPSPGELPRGGIVGSANVTDIVRAMDSDWFFGPRGLALSEAKETAFIPCAGQLGFFEWKPDDNLTPPEPARWMKRGLTPLQREAIDLPLFLPADTSATFTAGGVPRRSCCRHMAWWVDRIGSSDGNVDFASAYRACGLMDIC